MLCGFWPHSSQSCCLQNPVVQASICTELIKRLLQFGPALTAAAGAVAELDCLCSLAAAARELGYCRPQLVAESMIHIEGGAQQPAGSSTVLLIGGVQE